MIEHDVGGYSRRLWFGSSPSGISLRRNKLMIRRTSRDTCFVIYLEVSPDSRCVGSWNTSQLYKKHNESKFHLEFLRIVLQGAWFRMNHCTSIWDAWISTGSMSSNCAFSLFSKHMPPLIFDASNLDIQHERLKWRPGHYLATISSRSTWCHSVLWLSAYNDAPSDQCIRKELDSAIISLVIITLSERTKREEAIFLHILGLAS